MERISCRCGSAQEVVNVITTLIWVLTWLLPFVCAADLHSATILNVVPPVVEILYPPHQHLLLHTHMKIEIAMRTEQLRSPIQDPSICLGVRTVFRPSDIQAEQTNGGKETCFEQDTNYTTFNVHGLAPGVSYSVTVGFMNRGQLIGYSIRTFDVASILLTKHNNPVVRLSIEEAMDTAKQLQGNGEIQDATTLYRRLIEMFPTYYPAMYFLVFCI